MEKIDYRVEKNQYDNRIGLSIKYPEDIQRKWSEADVEIECDECGSTTLETEKTVDLLVIDCLDCSNRWEGAADTVLNWSESEEARATVRPVEGFSRVE